MNILKKSLLLYFTFWVFGIGIAFIFDNPDHLLSPDPDCPLCQVDKTELQPITSAVILPCLELIILYPDKSDCGLYSSIPINYYTTRAPPQV